MCRRSQCSRPELRSKKQNGTIIRFQAKPRYGKHAQGYPGTSSRPIHVCFSFQPYKRFRHFLCVINEKTVYTSIKACFFLHRTHGRDAQPSRIALSLTFPPPPTLFTISHRPSPIGPCVNDFFSCSPSAFPRGRIFCFLFLDNGRDEEKRRTDVRSSAADAQRRRTGQYSIVHGAGIGKVTPTTDRFRHSFGRNVQIERVHSCRKYRARRLKI